MCYKLIQRSRVTGLFAGQYNTKLHGTITGVIILQYQDSNTFKQFSTPLVTYLKSTNLGT